MKATIRANGHSQAIYKALRSRVRYHHHRAFACDRNDNEDELYHYKRWRLEAAVLREFESRRKAPEYLRVGV